jgi:hypothetical protein
MIGGRDQVRPKPQYVLELLAGGHGVLTSSHVARTLGIRRHTPSASIRRLGRDVRYGHVGGKVLVTINGHVLGEQLQLLPANTQR